MKTTSCVLNSTAILDAIRSGESEILFEFHDKSRNRKLGYRNHFGGYGIAKAPDSLSILDMCIDVLERHLCGRIGASWKRSGIALMDETAGLNPREG